MRNAVLLIIVISIAVLTTGCDKLPKAPAVWQCVLLNQDKFFCVNSDTKEEKELSVADPNMEMAQCLSLNDYESMQLWIKTIKDLAESKCKK
jgi:hypothetical protein